MVSIVHIISGLSTGGAEQALYNLLAGGLAVHHQNHVISLGNKGTMGPRIHDLGVPVTALGIKRKNFSGVSGVLNLRQVIQKIHPTIIQGWMYHGNLAAAFARKMTPDNPLLFWNIRHSLYDLRYEKWSTRQVIRLNRFFSSMPDVLLYNSRVARQQHETFGFSSYNGYVIPNGINVEKFSFCKKTRKRIRLNLGIPQNALVVGHVARLHPMKDHSLFLRAASTISRKYRKVHFLLSGRNVEIKNRTLAKLISPQLRDRFHLLGERDDIAGLMSAIDFFCLSSWSEGFPNVLGEAMAAGRPCITTDVGDSALMIGDTGVIVPPRDEDAFTAAIENFLLMSAAKRQALGEKARDRVNDLYPLGKIVGRYLAVYDNIRAEKNSVIC